MRAATAIARPFIDGCVGIIVDGTKRQLVQPCGQLAPGRDVTARLAGAQRNAQHRVVLKGHGPGERCHFAIVHHDEGDSAPGALQVDEEISDLGLKKFSRHAAKEGTHARAIIDVDSGGASANRIHARQVTRGGFQPGHNFVEMISRVRRVAGIPNHFFGENDFAVDHRCHLAVRGPQVKPNAAAFEMPSQSHAALARLRGLFGYLDRERVFVNAAHKLGVESARASRRIGLADVLTHAAGTRYHDSPAAVLPEERFDEPLYERQVETRAMVAADEALRPVNGNKALVALQGDGEGNGMPAPPHCVEVRVVGQHCGSKSRM